MKYTTILFDADDTLFDFSASQKNALHQTFIMFDLPTGFEDYHMRYNKISQGLWQSLEQGETTLDRLSVERFQFLFQEYGLEISAQDFNKVYLDHLANEAILMDGAEQLCSDLQDYQLAIITNGFKNVQHPRIKQSALCDSFASIITSEEAGYQKPAKQVFDYVFSKLGLTVRDKNNVMIVGDSLTSDILGGNNYGIDTCWFNPHKTENHTSIKPTYEIAKLLELKALL